MLRSQLLRVVGRRGVAAATGLAVSSCGIYYAGTTAAITAQCDGAQAAAAVQPATPNASYVAPKIEKSVKTSFSESRAALRQKLLPQAEEVDLDGEGKAAFGKRTDKQFIWQTLRTDRRIKDVAVWRHVDDGKAKITAIVDLGDELNGHVGIVHGGFTAALMDDFLGWQTMHEARVQGVKGAPLTASLNISYKRPVMGDGIYRVETQTDSFEARDRPGLPSWNVMLSAKIYDAQGNVCVEAKSRYVLKQY